MTIQIDKKHLLTFMRSENEKIMDLLLTFNVPDSIEGKKEMKPKIQRKGGLQGNVSKKDKCS